MTAATVRRQLVRASSSVSGIWFVLFLFHRVLLLTERRGLHCTTQSYWKEWAEVLKHVCPRSIDSAEGTCRRFVCNRVVSTVAGAGGQAKGGMCPFSKAPSTSLCAQTPLFQMTSNAYSIRLAGYDCVSPAKACHTQNDSNPAGNYTVNVNVKQALLPLRRAHTPSLTLLYLLLAPFLSLFLGDWYSGWLCGKFLCHR